LVASDHEPLNLFRAESYPEPANRSEGGCVSACTEEAQTASQRENARRFLADVCSRHPRILWMLGIFSAASLLIYFVCLAFLPQMDFRVYRMGAQHLFGPSLYSSELSVLSRHLLFTYPPVAALLFWPFAHLSSYAGQTVWDVIDIILLTALIVVSLSAAKEAGIERSDLRTALILLGPIGFFLYPVRSNLVLGQINILLVLMIVTDLTMTPSWRGRTLPRGLLVGCAAAIKLTPLVFIPYLAVSGQWREAKRAVATFGLATGVMFVVSPRASWQYFTNDAYDVKRVGNSVLPGNQTLHALLERAHVGLSPVLADCVLGVALFGGIAVAAVAYRRSSPMLGMLVCAATGLMVSPISWLHHYVWIVPFLVWLVLGRDRPRGSVFWAFAAVLVFAIVPPAHNGGGTVRFVQDNSYVLATLAFIALTGLMLWSRRSVRGRSRESSSREAAPVSALASS
jgi:alpha-1,2-mannosyltransferase